MGGVGKDVLGELARIRGELSAVYMLIEVRKLVRSRGKGRG